MSSDGQIEPGQKSGGESITAAVRGDRSARWRVLEACRAYLRTVVRRRPWTRSVSAAQSSDLVQKTIVDGWHHFSRFRGSSPGQLRAWLKAILIHNALNARRRPVVASIDAGNRGALVVDAGTPPSKAAQKKSTRAALEAAMCKLSDRHRTAIHLRLWKQWSFERIGAQLGISEDAARMLYGRAISRMRETMRPGHDPG